MTVFVIAGCVQVATKNGASHPLLISPPMAAAKGDNEFLAFAQRYSAMAAEDQKKEYAMVTQSLNRNKGDLTNRMKAAMMLALPSSRVRDNGRALTMLEEIQRDGSTDTETKTFAGLLKDYVGERLKLEDSAAKLGQKAAEEQKRADALQQKADSLQQKLDELKNIEKALTERDQAKPK